MGGACQTLHTNMADWDADSFEPEEPIKKAPALDKWEGEDEDEDVKDNWDDEEEEEKKVEEKKAETKVSEKKKLSEKIKEKENRLRKKQQEQEMLQNQADLTPEELMAEKLRVMKLQEESDMELAKDAFGVSTTTTTSTSNSVSGIDAMCPSSREDFTELEKLLKEKLTQFEKSVHYSSFLDSLFRELCISLEVEDMKKISNSLTVLLSEKQKQEKQNKGKKKKKGVVAGGGGFKAKMKDDLDYGGFDGDYAQDYDDFM